MAGRACCGAFCPERAQSQPPFGASDRGGYKAALLAAYASHDQGRCGIGGVACAASSATVFGGSGFIGRYVVQRLARAGWLVRVAVRHPDEALFLKPPGAVGQIVADRRQRPRPRLGRARRRRRRRRGQPGRHPARAAAGRLRRPSRPRAPRRDRRGRGARRGAAPGPCLGHRRRCRLAARPMRAPRRRARPRCAQASPTRPSCARRIVFGPEDGFFNRFAAHGAAVAGAAADRRRPDPVPAGLCRRRRRGGGGGARDAETPPARPTSWRARDLQLRAS